MKIFATTPEDNKREVMRLELDAGDVELLEDVADRLRRLVKIEEALEVVAMQAPTILGQDIPTTTADGADLLETVVKGWDAEEDIEWKPVTR